MSPRVTLLLVGAFGLWWIGYTTAELLGGRGTAGGILAFVALAAIVIIAGIMKNGNS